MIHYTVCGNLSIWCHHLISRGHTCSKLYHKLRYTTCIEEGLRDFDSHDKNPGSFTAQGYKLDSVNFYPGQDLV